MPTRPAPTVAVLAAVTLLGCIALPATPAASTPPVTAMPTGARTAEPTDSPTESIAPSIGPTSEPASLSPELSPTPTPSPPETPSPMGTATPAATPIASASPNPLEGWTGPKQEFARGNFRELSMVVDSAGVVHATATLNGAIHYLTNAGGTWHRTRLTEPPGDQTDSEVSLALDDDGTLGIVFTRWFCFTLGCSEGQIMLMRNQSGFWSQPVQVATGDSASLKLEGGHVHLAYLASEGRGDVACEQEVPLRYATDLAGQWTDELVAAHGEGPLLALDSQSRPVILFSDECEFLANDGLRYAVADGSPGDGFTVETLIGTAADSDRAIGLSLDATDRAHALFWRFSDEGDETETYYTATGAGSWLQPNMIFADELFGRSIATTRDGKVQLLASGPGGIWYATNVGGTFEARVISNLPGRHDNAAGLALDEASRPHILFGAGTYEEPLPGLWYAVGPAEGN